MSAITDEMCEAAWDAYCEARDNGIDEPVAAMRAALEASVGRELANTRSGIFGALQLAAGGRTAQAEGMLRSCLPEGYVPVGW